ncbi:MAG TPA: peptidoglycan DD-metalloendopeptidase family protein [Stenomitos sp.]
MSGNPTQERTQGEIPEISAFRYTGVSDKAPLNPLNLNGLSFGNNGRRLSDRLLKGVRFLVELAPKPTADSFTVPEPPSEGMSVFKYHLPLDQYRAQRRRSSEVARRFTVAATVAIAVPALGFFAWKHLPPPTAPKQAVVQPAAPAPAGVPYQVQAGDSLYTVAHSHHVKLKALLAANGLKVTHRLKIGQTLLIPTAAAPAVITTGEQLAAHEASGMAVPSVRQEAPARVAQAPAPVEPKVEPARPKANAAGAEKPALVEQPKAKPARRTKRTKYTIQDGDTLSEIATRFGVKTAAIVEINDLDFHTTLRVGRTMVIPASAEAEESARSYRRKDRRKVASRGLVGDLARAVSSHFLWPTAGRVSSYFGVRSGRMHTGLDIPNHPGAPIHASKSGVVVSAGWDGDYGKTVDISHGKGVVTRYAHCSKLLVEPGERVSAGQTIALVGETGRATGPHVHYEVRVNGRPIDPEKVM